MTNAWSASITGCTKMDMRRLSKFKPRLRMLTNARSFHLDAQTSQMAFHASSHVSSSAGGVNPPRRMTSASVSNIPGGGTTVRTHRRHKRSDVSNADPVESSISRMSLAIVAACDAFSGLARTCSNVPKGMAMDLGRLIQSGIPPLVRASRRDFVFLALAPTSLSLKSTMHTAYSPPNSTG